MKRKQWPFLKQGNKLQIIAPASKTDHPSNDILAVQKLVTSWGLIPVISPLFYGDDPDFANTQELQLQDISNALNDDGIAGIWCIRGGYGSMRLLDGLEKQKPPTKVKVFIGFSDITSLHVYLNQQWGWQTLHAPTALQTAEGRIAVEDTEILRAILFGEIQSTLINDLMPFNKQATEAKTIRSIIIGGNLTRVTRTLGTSYPADWTGKILLLEEEYQADGPRKVDGALVHLQRAGLFTTGKKPAAIVLGNISCSEDQEAAISRSLKRFADAADAANCPIVRCLNIGHGAQNHPVPLSTEATLILGEKPTLQIVTTKDIVLKQTGQLETAPTSASLHPGTSQLMTLGYAQQTTANAGQKIMPLTSSKRVFSVKKSKL